MLDTEFNPGDRVRTRVDGIAGHVVGFVPNTDVPIIRVTHSTRWPEYVGEDLPNLPEGLEHLD